MRKRKNNRRKKKILILTAASLTFCITAYKILPPIVRAAFVITAGIDFSSEPDNYTGENDYDYFGILGDEYKAEKESEKENISVSAKIDSGPKPYPEEWGELDGIISEITYEKTIGEKYIGLKNGGQIKNETDVLNSVLIEESKKEPDFSITLDGSPQVLIMHTHTTETYEPYERENFDMSFNYRTTDPSKNMIMVGNKIAEELEDEGIGVIHDTTIHDYPSYNGSYERSAETVNKILKENPTIKVVLDIHRDAIGSSDNIMQPVVEIDGKKAAQIMIISGCDDGTMDMPDYMKNFHFACHLQQQFNLDYPGLTRPVLFDYRKYNQDLTTGSLLIEVGNHGNTLEQAEYSGELIGKSLVKALKNLEE